MTVRMRSQVDNRPLQRYAAFIRATPRHIQTVVEQEVRPAMQQYTEREFVPYPPPIGKGIFKRFATPKQFRYVMRLIHLGLWTGRTGKLGKAWFVLVEKIATGATLSMGNRAGKARYIIGRFQQRFHAHTGWPLLQRKAPEAVAVQYRIFRRGLTALMRRELRQR